MIPLHKIIKPQPDDERNKKLLKIIREADQDHDNGEPLTPIERAIFVTCLIGYFIIIGCILHYVLWGA